MANVEINPHKFLLETLRSDKAMATRRQKKQNKTIGLEGKTTALNVQQTFL